MGVTFKPKQGGPFQEMQMNLDFLFLRRALHFFTLFEYFLTIPQNYGVVIISWQLSWLKKSSNNGRLAHHLQ